ncbi:MAG: tetratricopeptide repeat protein, partial [Syntrophales bacterium]|nr:tetratricopeptide repeat protein [Syntrophales bacterium]
MAEKTDRKKKERGKRIREERSRQLRRTEAENHHDFAVMHYRNRDFAEARRCLQKAITVLPNHLSSHQLLAQIALDEKNLPEAARIFRLILKKWPEESFAWYFLGVVLMDLRKFDEAVEAFQAFIIASGGRRSDALVKTYRRNARSAIREVARIGKIEALAPPPSSSPASETADLFQPQLTLSRGKAGRGRKTGNMSGTVRAIPTKSLPPEKSAASCGNTEPNSGKPAAPLGRLDLFPAKTSGLLRKPEPPSGKLSAPPELPVTPPQQPAAAVPATPLLDLSAFADPARRTGKPAVRFTFINEPLFAEMNRSGDGNPRAWQLWVEYHRIRLIREFDELLCLAHLRDIDQYWYQIETVSQVLRRFGGRVLLADEVGLGKTIEAGMVLKEYLLRGMVRKL